MPKNNKDLLNPEDIKAWEDFKGKKFLEGDKGEIFKKPIKENKKQDQIDLIATLFFSHAKNAFFCADL